MEKPFRPGIFSALAPLLLAAALLAVFWPGLSAPFLYDDFRDIVENPSIRSLSPLGRVLFPPMHVGTAGRPLSNLALAACHALSGRNPLGYHLLGLFLHIAATLALFFLLRRAGRRIPPPAAGEELFAFFCAAAFGLHPLAANSVVPCFRLPDLLAGALVLSCLLAGVKSAGSRALQALAGLLFCLAVCAKQDAAMAPFLFLLFLWVFERTGPAAGLRRFPVLFAGFGAGLVLLAALMLHSNSLARAGTFSRFTPLSYAAAQPEAILTYLKLALFPAKLCFDYQAPAPGASRALLFALVLLPLAAASAEAARRRLAAGFWACWFFLLLIPSSSFVPLNDLVNENRAYLAMIGPLACLLLLAAGLLGRLFRARAAAAFIVFSCLLCLVLGISAHLRARVMADPVRLWEDTAEKRPESFMAHFALAEARARIGDGEGAELSYRRTLELAPDFAPACNNLGALLLSRGGTEEALALLTRSLGLRPDSAQAENSLGWALVRSGKAEEGISHLGRAVELSPGFVRARVNLGLALWESGRADEAREQLARALAQEPENGEIAGLLERMKREEEGAAAGY